MQRKLPSEDAARRLPPLHSDLHDWHCKLQFAPLSCTRLASVPARPIVRTPREGVQIW